MKPPIETIRLSQQAKDKLIHLKKITGIEQWNILCRWALALSLSMKDEPPILSKSLDSSIEIQWKTFSGELSPVYIALVQQRSVQNEVSDVSNYFTDHLHRGISCLEGCFLDD